MGASIQVLACSFSKDMQEPPPKDGTDMPAAKVDKPLPKGLSSLCFERDRGASRMDKSKMDKTLGGSLSILDIQFYQLPSGPTPNKVFQGIFE